jgi:hypothetical protein
MPLIPGGGRTWRELADCASDARTPTLLKKKKKKKKNKLA